MNQSKILGPDGLPIEVPSEPTMLVAWGGDSPARVLVDGEWVDPQRDPRCVDMLLPPGDDGDPDAGGER